MGDYGGGAPAPAPEPEKICADRHKWSLAVTGATAGFMVVCVIGFGVHYNAEISLSSDALSISAACAIQSVFGIFVSVMLVQVAIFILSFIGICCRAKKDFYRVNTAAHAGSLIAIFVGCIIFGIKKGEEIYWFFWFAVIASFLCVFNLTIWIPSQIMRRREKLTQVKLDALESAGGGGGGY